jgi:hypothetical protein
VVTAEWSTVRGVVNTLRHVRSALLAEGGDSEMVNCAGRGEHAPARAMLVHDQVAVLGSRGAGDDDGMVRVGSSLPE